MPTFRKKPVEIEAVQWSGSALVLLGLPAPEWIRSAMASDPGTPGSLIRMGDEVHVGTLEGVMVARPGDWIIRGIKGELYPCKPDIFEATYDLV